MDKNIYWYEADYLGGHTMYSKEYSCKFSLYPDKVVTIHSADTFNLQIPYGAIKEVKKVRKRHPRLYRVFLLGWLGGLFGWWTVKEDCLCIAYNDGAQNQSPIFRIVGLEKAHKRLTEYVAQTRQRNAGSK